MISQNIVQSVETTLREREWEASLVVARKEKRADAVVELTLVDPAGGDLPEWHPGAHIDLMLPDGMTRQYSLCGSVGDRGSFRIGILRDPASRGGSQFVHEQIEVGSTVRVRGPRNHFPLVDAPEYLFIAGGIGITPLLPMIAEAQRKGAAWRLLYGGRTEASMAFLEELAQYGDKVTVFAQDKVGLLPLGEAFAGLTTDVRVYACGPAALLEAIERAAADGLAGRLHIEHFAARAVEAPTNALESFEVVCDKSGITLKVDAGQSILDVVEKAGIKVLASCRAGVCGTSEVDIVKGEADHRDTVLSRAERESNEFMLVCCSRSLTPRLVLNL